MNKDSIIKILNQAYYDVVVPGAKVASESTVEFLNQAYDIVASGVEIASVYSVEFLSQAYDSVVGISGAQHGDLDL